MSLRLFGNLANLAAPVDGHDKTELAVASRLTFRSQLRYNVMSLPPYPHIQQHLPPLTPQSQLQPYQPPPPPLLPDKREHDESSSHPGTGFLTADPTPDEQVAGEPPSKKRAHSKLGLSQSSRTGQACDRCKVSRRAVAVLHRSGTNACVHRIARSNVIRIPMAACHVAKTTQNARQQTGSAARLL